MAASSFLDVCRFNPTLGGTTDWTYSSAVTGYQSPAAAGAVNGAQYSYRAESADLSQWEVGFGTYNTSTGVLSRTTILFSTNSNAKVSFSTVPQVAIVALAESMVPQSVGQLPGTATNDNAAAGNVGEYIVSAIAPGSAVPLTNNVTANMTSLTLSAGDWEVEAVFYTSSGGTTVLPFMEVAINGTSATLPGRAVDGSNGVKAGSNNFENYSGSSGLNQTLVTNSTRVTLATSTTIYAVANVNFTVSTCAIYGVMRARRER